MYRYEPVLNFGIVPDHILPSLVVIIAYEVLYLNNSLLFLEVDIPFLSFLLLYCIRAGNMPR